MIDKDENIKKARPIKIDRPKEGILESIFTNKEIKDIIEGEFIKFSIEERLKKLEEGHEVTTDLVEQLIDWTKTGVSP